MNFALERRKNGDQTSDKSGGLISVFGLTIVFFAILTIFSFPSQTSAATLSKPTNGIGLVGWWTFDGADMTPNVRDRSGYGNHGNLYGQTSTSTSIGKVGQALSFDGINDTLSVNDSNSLDTPNALTVALWIYDRNDGMQHHTISKDTSGGNRNWIIRREGDTVGNYHLWNSGSTLNQYTPANSWKVNEWFHVTFIASVSGSKINFEVFINGVSIGTDSFPGTALQTGDSTLNMGSDGLGNFYKRQSIDDVRIYNRALSATEVKGLYNASEAKISATKSPGTLSNGLVGHWTFDGKDISGTSALDASGSGYIGTVIGATKTFGSLGQALSFDGSNDTVAIGAIDLTGTNKIAVSMWLNISSYNSTDDLAFELSGDTNSSVYGVFIDPNSSNGNTFQLALKGDVGFASAEYTRPSLGWHHYVAVFDKSVTADDPGNEVGLYIDGVLQTPTARTFNSDNTNNFGNVPAYIMSRNTSSLFMEGVADDVRIYNRLLTPSEIKQLYAMGDQKTNAPVNVTKSSLDTGLVGLWSFDGKDVTDKVYDRSGQGNHGYFIGGATSTAKTLGVLGQAMGFDGSNDLVTLGTDVVDQGTVTVCAWIYPKDTNNGGAIISNARFTFSQYLTNNRITLTSTNSNGIFSAVDAIVANQWQHVCGIRNAGAGGPGSIYINGTLNSSGNTNTPVGGFGLAIGNDQQNSVPYNGYIDDVRIYNRVLSASEIKQLYNMGR